MSSSIAPQEPLVAAPAAALQRMNIVIVGHVDHGKSTVIGRLLADTHSLPEGKAGADPGPVRAQLEAVRVRLPARRTQRRTGPGHHHRCRPGVLQERPAALPDPRRPRPHRVPQEHDHRRRARGGGPSGDRCRRGRAGELPAPRLHGLAAGDQAARRGGEQDGPGGMGPRRVRAYRHRVRRLPRSGRHPARLLHPGLGPRRRQHRRSLGPAFPGTRARRC